MATYDYTVATDFGGSFHFPTFLQELEDSSLTGLGPLGRSGNDVVVTADSSQQAAVDALVAAHGGTATTRKTQEWEENPKDTTQLETPQTAFSVTAAAVAKGKYKIECFLELNVAKFETLDSRVIAHFRIDNNIKCSFVHALDDWDGKRGMAVVTLKEGDTPVLDIQFERSGGDDTAEVRKKRIILKRMRGS